MRREQSVDAIVAWADKARECLAMIDREAIPEVKGEVAGPRLSFFHTMSSLEGFLLKLRRMREVGR